MKKSLILLPLTALLFACDGAVVLQNNDQVPTSVATLPITSSVTYAVTPSLTATAAVTVTTTATITTSVTPSVILQPSQTPQGASCAATPYVAGTAYNDGDLVSYRDKIYECVDGLYQYCQHENATYFSPVGIFKTETWKERDDCHSSVVEEPSHAPTSTPTASITSTASQPATPTTTATASQVATTHVTPSATITLTATPVVHAPNAPSNLTANISDNQVSLSWQLNNTDGVTFYVLRRSANAVEWQLIANLIGGQTSFQDSLSNPGQYQYKVYASNTAGASNDSAIVSVNYQSLGQSLYTDNCAACHKDGGIAVNLIQQNVADNWETKGWLAFGNKVDSMFTPNCDADCKAQVKDYIWQDMWRLAQVAIDDSAARGAQVIRLLTPVEYQRSIKRLTGVQLAAEQLPDVKFDSHFKYPSQADIGVVVYSDALAYFELAQTIAASANLSLIGCGESSCSNLADTLLLLFRRSATNSEISTWSGVISQYGSREFLRSALMSPEFLYRSELGTWSAADDAYKLSDHELITAMTIEATGKVPSLAQLKTNISSESAFTNFANSLVNSADAADYANEFIRYYAKTYELAAEKPGLSNAVIDAMFAEQSLFVKDWYQAGGALAELYTPNWTYANSTLADHYGMSVNGSSMQKVNTNEQRGGLLHWGLVQILNSDFAATSLVKRGKFIRENLLCGELGIPSGVDPNDITMPNHAITTRERWDVITGPDASGGQCWVCHQLMNEPGSVLEEFDQTGKYRQQEASFNQPNMQLMLETAGVLRSNDGQQVWLSYQNTRDLANFIGTSEQGQACFAQSYLRYASGLALNASNQTSREALIAQFKQKANLKDLMLARFNSTEFKYRVAAEQ